MTWIPGLIVLALGVAVGILMVRRFRGVDVADGRDLELRIADLQARRDELYKRLREIDQGLAPEEDREPLERAAARALRELDELQGDFEKRHPKLARERQSSEGEAPETKAAPATAASPARTFLSGFAYGAGLLLLVGGLIYWAGRDAKPRPDQGGPMSAPVGSEQPPHPEMGDLPSDVVARIDAITSHLETNPDDLDARKQLGYIQLGSSRFVEAFEQAGEILARSPEDPDGLYLQGVVRLTMGQWQMAEELLARALDSDPSHLDSLTAAGVIRLRLGDYERAIALWEQGRQTLGGSHPMLDRMIALAREGRTPEEILGMPAAPEPSQPAPVPAAAPEPTPDAITISIDVAPDARPAPGATLFVLLRGPGGGPPVAVKRVSAPRFPLTLTLSQADSMMGVELPSSGTVTARLDTDGSASTRDPADLSASAEAALGDVIVLVLDAG